MKTCKRHKTLMMRGVAAPAIMVVCAILTGEWRLFADPMTFCIVLATSLLIGATISEFFSKSFTLTLVLITMFAGGYYFVWIFPGDSIYFIIFFGGLIGGVNLGLLSPKQFIIK